MEKRMKELNSLINDYVVAIGADENLVYANMESIYNINFNIFSILHEKYDNDDIDVINIKHSSWYENIELIKEFYRENNIDFDIDKVLNDGTIDYKHYEEINMHNLEDGQCYYCNGHKGVEVCNNGFITDAAILIHELSHLRNQPDDYRNQLSNFFTEALATLDELLFIDFLEKKGYKEEAKWLRKGTYMFFYETVSLSIPVFELFLLYNKVGSISKDSFNFYYGSLEDYEEDINEIEELEDYELDVRSSYMIAALLAPYLYFKIKENKLYMNVIKSFYEVINSGDFNECFNHIGLKDFNEDVCNMLYKDLKKFVKKKL